MKQQGGMAGMIGGGGGGVITRRVVFVEGAVEDKYEDYLKAKYTPCNPKKHTLNLNSPASAAVKKSGSGNGLSGGSAGMPKLNSYELFGENELLQIIQWNEVRRIGGGLHNLGNTCFLNSALQCLTYTPPLANYAFQKGHSKSCTVAGFCLFCALEQQIVSSFANSGSAQSPKAIVSNLKKISKNFRLGRQEDSHEFLRYFIDTLQKCCLHGLEGKIDPKVSATTVIHKIFGGSLQSQVKCSECGFESNTIDPCLDLSLEIAGPSVESALKHFAKAEILDKDNKYKCSKCKKLVKASKQFTIREAPNVLTIQLKRFASFFGGKIDKHIKFEETLDLAPYLSDNNKRPCLYKLYGVLVHWGSSTRSGHYYSFVKSSAQIWYCMDDSSVKQVSLSTVLQQKAYLLFYTKVRPQSPSPAPTLKRKIEQEDSPIPLAEPGPVNKKVKNEDSKPKLSVTPAVTPKNAFSVEVLKKPEAKAMNTKGDDLLVETWKGKQSILTAPAPLAPPQAKYTDLDYDYDKGKTKKRAKTDLPLMKGKNPFQAKQNERRKRFLQKNKLKL